MHAPFPGVMAVALQWTFDSSQSIQLLVANWTFPVLVCYLGQQEYYLLSSLGLVLQSETSMQARVQSVFNTTEKAIALEKYEGGCPSEARVLKKMSLTKASSSHLHWRRRPWSTQKKTTTIKIAQHIVVCMDGCGKDDQIEIMQGVLNIIHVVQFTESKARDFPSFANLCWVAPLKCQKNQLCVIIYSWSKAPLQCIFMD